MAKFTRAEIRKIIGESCTDEIENQLVALHLGVVDPLKDDVTRYKADAEKLPGVQKELDDLKAQGDGGYKAKYEAEHKAFGDYKNRGSKVFTGRKRIKRQAGYWRPDFNSFEVIKWQKSKIFRITWMNTSEPKTL